MTLDAATRQIRALLERHGVEPRAARATLLRAVTVRQLRAAGLPDACRDDLPGLFATHLVTLAPAVQRRLDTLLEAPELSSCWTDPTTLGWAYQFWNDPGREAIDRRIGPRGRVQLDELAQKTQLFTERYMVEWLVQNSLDVAGAPAPYRVRAGAEPRQLDSLRVLDPACGTGHFLVGAFDFLAAAYQAAGFDAAHTMRSILECNIHGIDLDPVAVGVAAVALYLQAKRLAPHEPVPAPNLVACDFPTPAAASTELAEGLAELRWRGTLVRPEQLPKSVLQHLQRNTPTTDLGLRTATPAPRSGARLRAMLQDAHYDVVLSNPPYLATAKIELDPARVDAAFDGMPDLFAAFTKRSLELCKPDGRIAFVALANWMFLSSFRPVRELLLRGQVELVADVGKGAFRHASKLIQTAMVVARPAPVAGMLALGARVGSRDEIATDQPERIAAALLEPAVFEPFDPAHFGHVDGAPFLFWLTPSFLQRYAELPKIEHVATGAGGIATGHNERFVRAIWEVLPGVAKAALRGAAQSHVPYLKGAEGREWIEPCRSLLRRADEVRFLRPSQRVEAATELGVAYTTIGQRFGARLHTTPSVRDVAGASFFAGPEASVAELVCALNQRSVRELACALNPTVNFQLGDVKRLPFDRDPAAEAIVHVLRTEFECAERANELSPAFSDPSIPSAWPEAQRWAQRQVDRARGAALEPFTAVRQARGHDARLSHALGVAFGRFGDGGLLDAPPAESVAWFVADAAGLAAPALERLRRCWTEAAPFEEQHDLVTWLREDCFAAHRRRYENRPIYLPLASKRRTFVVWAAWHRLSASVLAEIATALEAKRGTAGSARAELDELIHTIETILLRGPHDDETPREVDAPFALDVDDGIAACAASLWPLLEPHWKDPKRWWRELAAPAGKRDFEWSSVAARYFPTRVHAKCIEQPSLALAHQKFMQLHPIEAARWERRMRGTLAPHDGTRILAP